MESQIDPKRSNQKQNPDSNTSELLNTTEMTDRCFNRMTTRQTNGKRQTRNDKEYRKTDCEAD